MKMKIILFVLLAVSCLQQGKAQTVNWNALESTKHLVNLGIGWDYSLSYSQGYAYQPGRSIPIVLNGNVSIPFGQNLFDDLKVRAGGQIVLLNQPYLKGGLSLNAIYRRYENSLVRLQNFGSDIKGFFGYYKPDWFIAGEAGFDKAIVTHFYHTDSYKENILQNVHDGWFDPATGGNFLYGFQTGLSFKKSDITLNTGKVVSQDFKTTPLIPYYLTLGFNYKIF